MDLTCDEEMLPAGESPRYPPLPAQTSTLPGQLLPVNFQMTRPSPPLDMVNYPEMLECMLQNDSYNRPDPDYFTFQSDISKAMRTVVTGWMRDVCEEEGFTENVFSRATNIMDRFLSVHKIERSQFQLLGATCLLLSSKWSGNVMNPERLIYYTANSITMEMVREWEFLILIQLDWDVYSLTPNEFIEPFMQRLAKNLLDPIALKKKILYYTAFCATDYSYSIYLPSTIAAASFAAAVQQESQVSQGTMDDVLSQLQVLTNVQMDLLKFLSEDIVLKQRIALQENSAVPGANPGMNQERERSEGMDESVNNNLKYSEYGELEQADTPTDVRDIDF